MTDRLSEAGSPRRADTGTARTRRLTALLATASTLALSSGLGLLGTPGAALANSACVTGIAVANGGSVTLQQPGGTTAYLVPGGGTTGSPAGNQTVGGIVTGVTPLYSNANAGGTGPNNVACGDNAQAQGNNSGNTAFGANTQAQGNNGVNSAFGNNALANGDNSGNTANGVNANASGTGANNTASGNNANASGTGSDNVAVGNTNNASGNASHNTALGSVSNASGDGSGNTSSGYNANASGGASNNTAAGRNADAGGNGSSNVASGYYSNANGANSGNTALGTVSNASGSGSFNTASGFRADASGNTSNNVASGHDAKAGGDNSSNTAVGRGADASGGGSDNYAAGDGAGASGAGSRNTATGPGANASGAGSFNSAYGLNANASGDGSNNTASGRGSNASGANSFNAAFGSYANASGAQSVNTAIGLNANGSGDNAGNVAIGSTSYASANGGSNLAVGDGASAGGSVAGGAGTDFKNAGATALGVGAQAGATAAGQTNATAVGQGALANVANGTALGQGASVTAANAVALGRGSVADTANTVSVGAAGAERRIVNVGAGTLSASSTDAVNGAQLYATNQTVANNGNAIAATATALGGNASYNPATGVFTGPTYTFGSGAQFTTVGSALGNLDTRTTTNTNGITALQNGTAGLVQQANNASPITVGAATAGTQVNVAGTAGDRQITGVAAGNIASAASTDAVNGGQLFATNQQVAALQTGLGNGTVGLVQQDPASRTITVGAATDGNLVSLTGTQGDRRLTGVAAGTATNDAVNLGQLNGVTTNLNAVGTGAAAALGGNASYNPATGVFTGPTYTFGSGAQFTNVGSALGNLDTRTTTNTDSITALQNGQSGLVQQANPNAPITVGAATGGTVVTVAGTAGNRQITGVAAGGLAANSSDAVNGSQLFATNAQVAANTANLNTLGSTTAAAIGGGATYNAATGVTGVSYQLNGSGQTFTDVVAGQQALASGAAGPVQYATPGTPSNRLQLVGTGGPVTLTNVAAGALTATSTDAVNGSQLFATNQAVVALQNGSSGVFVANNPGGAPAPVASGSGAVAGGYGAVASGGSATAVGTGAQATQFGATAVGAGAVASGDPTTAMGFNAQATGNEASAFGAFATASADNTTALGRSATASGTDAVAVGAFSSATQANSVAIGQGVATSRANQVAIGNASQTYTLAGVTSAQSSAAQTGATRFLTSDASGNLAASNFGPNDIAGLDGRVSNLEAGLGAIGRYAYASRIEARRGIAAVAATAPVLMPSAPGKTTVTVKASTYRGEYGGGFTVAHRLDTALPAVVFGSYSNGSGREHVVSGGAGIEF